jgi:glycosyltransferase involved in cell wall biosynthesis
MGDDDLLAFKNRKMGPIYFYLLGFADKVVAISPGLYERCVKSGYKKEKITFIPNGADPERFRPAAAGEKERLKQELGCAGRRVFLSVGAIEPRKGYDFLIDAWGSLRERFEPCALYIIGTRNTPDNPCYLSLKEKIKQKGFDGVIFLGKRDDVELWMRVSEAFLFCSLNEGFGNVMIEALFSNVPVIARSIPGVTPDILSDRGISREVHSDRPEDFASETADLLAGKAGSFEGVRRRFDIGDVAERYKELYAGLV